MIIAYIGIALMVLALAVAGGYIVYSYWQEKIDE